MKCSKHSRLFENRIEIEKEKLIDAKCLADCLGLSIWTIRKWKSEDTIPFIKLGRSIRYNLMDVFEHLQKRR